MNMPRIPDFESEAVFNNIATIREAAHKCGYSAGHIRLLADTGRITAKISGGVWLIYLPSLSRYIQNRLDNEKARCYR